MEVVSESDSIVRVCITMTTSPTDAMLATQVNLALVTVSGTGKIVETIGHNIIRRLFVQHLSHLATMTP